MRELAVMVTIDVECDKSPTWRTPTDVAFRGVTDVIPRLLTPLFDRYGIEPTYLVSSEVLTHGPSMDRLIAAPRAELGTHLHLEYCAPRVPSWHFGGTLASGMQRELAPALEREKLETLTAMFRQHTGSAPRSFRAGRFGVGPATGDILADLGYTTDTSVTPHVCWTTASGVPVPDFRGAPELPHFVAPHAELTTPGSGSLCEVPVTILPALPGGQPRWLRPWFSDGAAMQAIIEEVANEPLRDGIRRPLVFMFHSCELVPQASPYPQSLQDVQVLLTQLELAFATAMRAGAVPMTLDGYATRLRESRRGADSDAATATLVVHVAPVSEAEPPALDTAAPFGDGDGLPVTMSQIERAIVASSAQPWFAYSARERKDRWELWEACRWIKAHLPRDARILSAGCGIGVNLLALHANGFTQLEGFDIDERAINAAQELSREIGATGIRLWTDDGVQPLRATAGAYDAIEAMNWVMLVPGLELTAFLNEYAALLRPGGVLFLDVIDAEYDTQPGNQWNTADRELLEHARRPSEYKLRPSLADVRAAAAQAGLEIVGTFSRKQRFPKRVYVLRKSHAQATGPSTRQVAAVDERPRLKIIADVPNWIFERHARTLQRLLSQDFRIEVGFHTEPTNEDDYDLIYPLEWNLANIAAIRRPSKWVTGIRSHVSWERFNPDALKVVLREKFVGVHVVSQRLHDIFASHVPGLALLAHGVDTRFFTPSAASDRRLSTLRVGWAGNRKTRTKNFDELVAPLGKIPGVELAFCGYADRNLGINEMREWYDTLDVVVHASGSEGHNNTLLEAAAMARAIVTTDTGTVPEWLVHGKSALVVPRDKDALAAGIIALRDDATARGALGRAAREQVLARWDWHARVDDFRKFFTAALDRSSPAHSLPSEVAA